MLKNRDEITTWLNQMKVKNYHIKDNLSVDVDGDVDLINKKLTKIPLQFGRVDGSFICHDNELSSLWGAPHTVNKNFYCNYNKLTSLQGGPHTVNKNFYCNDNELTSLKGCPQIIGGDFICTSNKLISLKIKDLPLEINKVFCFEQDLKLIEIKSLYDDKGLIQCSLTTLKKTLSAYELNQSLHLNLPNKIDNTAKNVKI